MRGSWLVKLADDLSGTGVESSDEGSRPAAVRLSPWEAMAIGTAGFTAMQCIDNLER